MFLSITMKPTLPCTFLFGSKKRLALLYVLLGFLSTINNVTAQTVTTGKSYINISRPNGGTFLPGDTLEVRATIAVNGGNSTTRVNFIRYNDTINLAKFDYIPGTLRMLSNEGRLQYQYTDGADTDSAHIDYPSGRLRFNVGNTSGSANVNTQGTSTTNAGRLWGALWPTFSGNCIRMYVYRVVIKNTPSIVAIDSTIRLSAGNFRYRIGSSSTDALSNFTPYFLKMAPDYGLCSNAVGANAIVGESGGTFGSGATQNKAGGTPFVPAPYTFRNFATNNPNDNYYGVANRTSADGTLSNNLPYSSGAGASSRVFNVWEVIGDHTGAADPYLGNPPTTNGGYAVIINASYQTNRAFEQTITNLCEETYYEFSAWFRNICRRCGCDSSGKISSQTGFVPGPGNDSSGVRPNLSFKIDNEDYYTTGNIAFTGLWVKKGFVFKTRAGQTSMTLTIRNNAPGGGGNDWAIDDIGLTTCLPNMQYSPSITPNVCAGNALTLYDTVRSYFNNYTHHQWQESTNGGANWTNIGLDRDSIPYWNSTLNVWEYVTSYTTPVTTIADSGKLFRLVAATSSINLGFADCRTTDVMNNITLSVLDCGEVLSKKLISFNGRMSNNNGILSWITNETSEQLYFDIEKSVDGINFSIITTINSNRVEGENFYSYTDPTPIEQRAYYRVKMRDFGGRTTYSRILQLSASAATPVFSFISVINPFSQSLIFDISSSKTGTAKADLIDQLGNTVKRKSIDIRDGITQFTFDNTNNLPVGIYILKVQMDEVTITRKVVKQNL